MITDENDYITPFLAFPTTEINGSEGSKNSLDSGLCRYCGARLRRAGRG